MEAKGPVCLGRGMATGETGCSRFECVYPTLSLGGCQTVGQLWDTALGLGKHNLRCGTQPELAQGPWACVEARTICFSGSQTHRMRIEWGPTGWI